MLNQLEIINSFEYLLKECLGNHGYLCHGGGVEVGLLFLDSTSELRNLKYSNGRKN
jgi:hypothetical protein